MAAIMEDSQRRYHAWGSLHKHLKDLSPRKVLDVETSFHRLLRRYMSENDVQIWDDHVNGSIF